jgi:hypothetical protein
MRLCWMRAARQNYRAGPPHGVAVGLTVREELHSDRDIDSP